MIVRLALTGVLASVAVLFATGCEDKTLGRSCDVGADAGPSQGAWNYRGHGLPEPDLHQAGGAGRRVDQHHRVLYRPVLLGQRLQRSDARHEQPQRQALRRGFYLCRRFRAGARSDLLQEALPVSGLHRAHGSGFPRCLPEQQLSRVSVGELAEPLLAEGRLVRAFLRLPRRQGIMRPGRPAWRLVTAEIQRPGRPAWRLVTAKIQRARRPAWRLVTAEI